MQVNPLHGVGAFGAETYFISNIYISVFTLLELVLESI